MPRPLSLAAVLGFVVRSTLAGDPNSGKTLIGGCQSYGMDFQGGGTYFQNVLSQDSFTFVQEFSGCQKDNSSNILVDPHGDQVECTETPLTPDDTDQMSTCPKLKSQLESGDWSILIISNNGADGVPIAYQRDFALTVGTQSTITATPTVLLSSTIKPIVNVTVTTTNTEVTTLAPSTTTVPKVTVQKTKTVTPKPVLVTTSVNLGTVTIPKLSVTVSKVIKTRTASCHLPQRQPTQDPVIKIWPYKPAAQSIVQSAVSAAGVRGPTGAPRSAKLRYARDPIAEIDANREKWLRERSERLRDAAELDKRAPDAQPLTVTEQNTDKFVTSTIYSTAAPITSTTIATSTITSTVTPAPITVESGKTVLAPVTVTAPPQTKTKTTYGISKVTSSRVQTVTITITTTAPSAPASKSACRTSGGIYY